MHQSQSFPFPQQLQCWRVRQNRLQLCQRRRLDDITLSAQHFSALLILIIDRAAAHNDDQLVKQGIFLQTHQQIKTVFARHIDIQKQQVDFILALAPLALPLLALLRRPPGAAPVVALGPRVERGGADVEVQLVAARTALGLDPGVTGVEGASVRTRLLGRCLRDVAALFARGRDQAPPGSALVPRAGH